LQKLIFSNHWSGDLVFEKKNSFLLHGKETTQEWLWKKQARPRPQQAMCALSDSILTEKENSNAKSWRKRTNSCRTVLSRFLTFEQARFNNFILATRYNLREGRGNADFKNAGRRPRNHKGQIRAITRRSRQGRLKGNFL